MSIPAILGITPTDQATVPEFTPGAIGAVIGLLPGLGGAVSDWLAYGSTVALNPKEEFGNGNIRGVIGPEGSNNAQKATSMIPTVLFGIPGASFAAVLIALFMYLGFEVGTVDMANDTKFFDALTNGFMGGTILVFFICIFANKTIVKITNIPYKYFFVVVLTFVVWACVQYTGGWEDYAILILTSIVGVSAKKFKFSRPALIIGYILSERIEALTVQMTTLYDIQSLLERPIFLTLVGLIVIILLFGIFNKSKMEYT
jgi:TctA family transporter